MKNKTIWCCKNRRTLTKNIKLELKKGTKILAFNLETNVIRKQVTQCYVTIKANKMMKPSGWKLYSKLIKRNNFDKNTLARINVKKKFLALTLCF